MVISIQTVAGHTLFACTVGDLGHAGGIGDVSLDSWACLEGMISVVKRTGHSSYYVEKGMSAMGKTAKQMGIQGEYRVNGGGEFIMLPFADRHFTLDSLPHLVRGKRNEPSCFAG